MWFFCYQFCVFCPTKIVQQSLLDTFRINGICWTFFVGHLFVLDKKCPTKYTKHKKVARIWTLFHDVFNFFVVVQQNLLDTFLELSNKICVFCPTKHRICSTKTQNTNVRIRRDPEISQRISLHFHVLPHVRVFFKIAKCHSREIAKCHSHAKCLSHFTFDFSFRTLHFENENASVTIPSAGTVATFHSQKSMMSFVSNGFDDFLETVHYQ